jgi:hypothetical protein
MHAHLFEESPVKIGAMNLDVAERTGLEEALLVVK